MSPLDTPRRNADLDTALAEARATYAAARPNSAALHETARAHLAGGSTRSVLFYPPFPTAMASGHGCTLIDVDGREYLDLCGEYTAGLFGHSNPRIIAALKTTLDRGLNLAAPGADEVAFAAGLTARFPLLERLRFTNSGTEANLLALATARAATGRSGLMAFRGGYHGGVLTFTTGAGSPVNLPIPTTLADYNDPEGAAKIIRATQNVAAVLVEPMLGSGGCIPATPAFLAALHAATRETGALLIFDEVMTSRHGPHGLGALLGVTPDLTTLGKYLAGGMSFGAFGGRADLMAAFDGHRPGALPHAGTFNNNVLSMAAGRVALDVFDTAAAAALFARGETLRARLNAAAAGLPLQFTGVGSMLSVHFRAGPIDRPTPATPTSEALRELLFLDLLEAGIYLARRGMVALSLPVGDAECDRFADAICDFIAIRRPFLETAC